jgi:Fe-Mn family superoxide dismutase
MKSVYDPLLKKIEKIQESIGESLISNKNIISEIKSISVEKLPYSYDSLERFVDSETMKTHYSKHYKGYVEKLNKELEKIKGDDVELEDIIKRISKYNKKVKNNGGGAFNHALFWRMLSPKKQTISGPILKKIESSFGSFDKFKEKFEESAKSNFGSGWVWLVLTKNGRLKIMTTPNQDNPLMDTETNGGFPLLGLDLWEHAYYLKYKNERDKYVNNFWKVVNWEFVNECLEGQTKKKTN